MKNYSIVVFGSFLHYSTQVAQAIFKHPNLDLIAIISTPPRPAGRQHTLQKTHTHLWAEEQSLPIFTPEKLNQQSLALTTHDSRLTTRPDFILSCGYSKLIPKPWLNWPKLAPLNFHPSLLPKYPGTRPAEFALLFGEERTGVTLHIMDEHFDTGPLLVQKTLPIDPQDNRETLYQKLYDLESHMAVQTIPDWEKYQQFANPQDSPLKDPYARALTRDDGFIPWKTLQALIDGKNVPKPIPLLEEYSLETNATNLDRMFRALYPYPGIWTKVKTQKGEKRVKILTQKLINHKTSVEQIQIEGKNPQTYNSLNLK